MATTENHQQIKLSSDDAEYTPSVHRLHILQDSNYALGYGGEDGALHLIHTKVDASDANKANSLHVRVLHQCDEPIRAVAVVEGGYIVLGLADGACEVYRNTLDPTHHWICQPPTNHVGMNDADVPSTQSTLLEDTDDTPNLTQYENVILCNPPPRAATGIRHILPMHITTDHDSSSPVLCISGEDGMYLWDMHREQKYAADVTAQYHHGCGVRVSLTNLDGSSNDSADHYVISLDMDGTLCHWRYFNGTKEGADVARLEHVQRHTNVCSKDCGELNGASIASMCVMPTCTFVKCFNNEQQVLVVLVPNGNGVQYISKSLTFDTNGSSSGTKFAMLTNNSGNSVGAFGEVLCLAIIKNTCKTLEDKGIWCVCGTSKGMLLLCYLSTPSINDKDNDKDNDSPLLQCTKVLLKSENVNDCCITDVQVRDANERDNIACQVQYLSEIGLYGTLPIARSDFTPATSNSINASSTDTSSSVMNMIKKDDLTTKNNTNTSSTSTVNSYASSNEDAEDVFAALSGEEEEVIHKDTSNVEDVEGYGIEINSDDDASVEEEDNPFASHTSDIPVSANTSRVVQPLYITRTPFNNATSSTHTILHWTPDAAITRLSLSSATAEDEDKDTEGYVYECHPMNRMTLSMGSNKHPAKFVDTIRYDLACVSDAACAYATMLPSTTDSNTIGNSTSGGTVLYKTSHSSWTQTLPAHEYALHLASNSYGTAVYTTKHYLRCYTNSGLQSHMEVLAPVYTLLMRGSVMVVILMNGIVRYYVHWNGTWRVRYEGRVPFNVCISEVTWAGIVNTSSSSSSMEQENMGQVCIMLNHVQLMVLLLPHSSPDSSSSGCFVPILDLSRGKYDIQRNRDTLRYYPIGLVPIPSQLPQQHSNTNVMDMVLLGVALYNGATHVELRQGRLPVTSNIPCGLPLCPGTSALEHSYLWNTLKLHTTDEVEPHNCEDATLYNTLDQIVLRLLHSTLQQQQQQQNRQTNVSTKAQLRARVLDLAGKLSTRQGMVLGMQLCQSVGEEAVCRRLQRRIEALDEVMAEEEDDDNDQVDNEVFDDGYTSNSRAQIRSRNVTPEERGINMSVAYETADEEDSNEEGPTQLLEDRRSTASLTPTSPVRKRFAASMENDTPERKRTRTVNPFQRRKPVSNNSAPANTGTTNTTALPKHAFASPSPSPTKRLSRRSTFGRKSLEMSQRGRHII